MAEANVLVSKYGRSFTRGQVIFREGEEGPNMYIIQQGKVRISRDFSGTEHLIAVLGKGDFFGEMALINQTVRTGTAVAVDDVTLLEFNREGLVDMIEKNARIAFSMIDKLCRRLRQAHLQIRHLVQRDAVGLVMFALSSVFKEKCGDDKTVPLDETCGEIALQLDLPKDEVRGALDQCAARGAILIEAEKIILKNPDALVEAAGDSGPRP